MAVIVVGIDGSESSKQALRWAVRQAELTGATLRAVEVWRLPNTYGMAPDYPDVDFEGDVRRELDGILDEVVKEHPELVVTPVVAEGHPAWVLVEQAKDADLLVVGSHGRGAFTGMLLGSVSQHCVQQAGCPVVVVPSLSAR
ncbi:MAG TPA: universal stress protein [Marmoricola sp.]|nr:universal stress protein [Marmoricola sp.]